MGTFSGGFGVDYLKFLQSKFTFVIYEISDLQLVNKIGIVCLLFPELKLR